MKKLLKTVAVFLAVILLVVLGYAAYVLLDYHRIEDDLALDVVSGSDKALPVGEELTALTWNLGFGAYTQDFSFFLDGGKYARGWSEDSVTEGTLAMLDDMEALAPDILLLQEVDVDADRSHHVDQTALIAERFGGYSRNFAANYDSSYLFYPFHQPIGRSYSGIMTLSDSAMGNAVRRSLPIEQSLMKLVDLDRCYSVTRMPVANGKMLSVYNLHLSAYISNAGIATEQLEMLLGEMQADYEAGHYVLAGGDFNKDLLSNSSEVFGYDLGGRIWAQPFPTDKLTGNVTLVSSYQGDRTVPTCRDCAAPYTRGETFVITLDGFLVSDNIEVVECEAFDMDFMYSDHNPVRLVFRLAE